MTFRPAFRRIACLLGASCLLLLAGWLFRAPLLTAVARAWEVNDPGAKADVIVVLGGRPELRPAQAARLFHEGAAGRILYMDVKPSPLVEQGLVLPERELTRRVLLSNGVPQSDMVAVGENVASTYDESLAVRAWLATNRIKSILIATDLSHTRRARWIFRKELKGAGVEILVSAIVPREYGTTNWWLHEDGLLAFQSEWLKSIYYWVKY